MLLKVVILFLAAVVLLSFMGLLRGKKSGKCPSCGAPLIGKGPCPCKGRRG